MAQLNIRMLRIFLFYFGLDTVYLQVTLRPFDVRVADGMNVTFSCIYNDTSTSDASSWTIFGKLYKLNVNGINGQCDRVPQLPSGFYPYCMINVFNMTISPVPVNLHGTILECSQKFAESNQPNIFVEVPVKNVHMSLNNISATSVIDCVDNENILLECNSSIGRPQPNITWYFGDSYINATDISSKSQLLHFNASEDAFNYTTSILTFNVSRSYNKKLIFCNSSNLRDFSPVSSNITVFNVQYPPVILVAKNMTVIELKTVNFTCPLTRGNPLETHFIWSRSVDSTVWLTETFSIDRVSRQDEGVYNLTISNIMKQSNGTEVKGYSTKMIFMKVLFPPEGFNVTCSGNSLEHEHISDTFFVTRGTNLTLICIANSNPSPKSYFWSGQMNASQAKLNFIVTEFHKGDYTCTAENSMKEIPGNTTIGLNSSTYHLEVLVPPEIQGCQNITVIEGKPVEFKCDVILMYPQETQFYWIRKTDNKTWIDKSFSIPSVNRSDESEYMFLVSDTKKPTCGAESPRNSSTTLYMRVYFRPEQLHVTCVTDSTRNESIVEEFNITEGTNMTLSCSAKSKPSPTSYSWSGILNSTQASLTFYVDKKHSGNYTCTANNIMNETSGSITTGMNSKTYRLNVLYAPEIEEIQNKTAVEGKELVIQCRLRAGNPSTTSFQWIRKKDDRTWPGQTLTINNITRNVDNTYTCLVNFTIIPTYGKIITGLSSREVNVDIMYKASITYFVIEGHTTQNNVTVNETDTVTFRCGVESNPGSFMNLTFGDKYLVEMKITKDLTYKLNNTKCTDWGKYMCFGHNSFNNLQDIPRQYIYMYVNCSPRPSSTVSLIYNVTNVTSEQHVSSVLTFKALAYPKPSVRWYRKQNSSWNELFSNLSNNILTSSSDDHLEYNLTVQNISQSDYGQYRLTLTNSFGRHIQLFNLIPNDKPNQPKDFGIYKEYITEKSVTLWWEPGFDGGLPQKFIIEIKENTIWKNYTSVEDTDVTIMNVTVTGLRSGTQYNFCIYASNQLGSTRFPDEITVRTKAVPVMEPGSSSIVGPAAGGTIGGVFAIALIALALLFVRKRRMEMSQKDKHTHEYQNMSFMKDAKQNKRLPPLPNEDLHDIHDRQTQQVEETHPDKDTTQFKMLQKSKEAKQHTVYENMNLTEDAKQSRRFISDPIEDGRQMLYNNKGDVSEDPETRKSKMQQKPNEVKHHPEYENMNLTEDAKHRKRTPTIPTDDAYEVPDQQNQAYHVKDAEDHQTLELLEIINKISLSDLLSYVTSKTSEDYVHEYTRFPLGIIDSISYSFARKPQNAPLNRYQGIYPYDHSRVVIPAEPDFFINANYIDGHSKKKAYIASLGPTVRHTLGFQTFWKMVWHEKSDVIVMLTNLQEPSGMKCEKYWADYGTTREVGDFTIKSVTEEIAAEYTVRTFNVSKKGESRSVTQLHYTAWPDKKVPEDVTSLIEFWQRVKAAPTRSLGPLVVHCSAGIGRTGTYIALDRLFEEGKTTDFVNVFDCVMSMRQQRVNMVQTQDQYVYLHQALVYCLVFDTEPVTAENIEEYVKTTSHNVYIKLFEQLKQSVEVESTYETEARTRNCDDDARNRTQADIPGDAHRIRLFLDKGSDESDYINAVYLNSFKRLSYFIIAQSPLPNTLDDFVSMLYQENCCCIVSLDDYQQKATNNAAYLPAENQHATYGTCTISSTMLDSKPAYSVRKLKIGHSSRYEKGMKIAHHFEYTGWKHDERIPKDVNMFVEFVQEVEEYATQLADEHSHILVHCLTGSGRSGLFCAVSNLIQKMGQDRQVSVVNTLRQVRARRKTAIRNTEQLKFCYQSVYAFVKNYKV